jgi:hypothetical protein
MFRLVSLALGLLSLRVARGTDVAASPKSVVRINHGVVFTNIGNLMNGVTAYKHMFAITAPSLDPPTLVRLPCETEAQILLHCRAINSLVDGIDAEYRGAFADLDEEIELIFSAIGNVENGDEHDPTRRTARAGRRKRAATTDQPTLSPDYCRGGGITNDDNGGGVLAALGKVASSLFGLVDNEQLKVAAKHVCELADSVDLNRRQIVQSSEELSSISGILGNEITAAQGGMRDISDRIGVVQRNLVNVTAALAHDLDDLAGRLDALERAQEYIIDMQAGVERFEHAATEYLSRARDFVYGLHTLLRGYLPPELVTTNDVNAVLNHVVEKVLPRYRALNLVHANPAFYFQMKSLSYTRSDNYIFITLMVPLKYAGGLLTVYRVDRTYIGTSQENPASTRVDNLPDMFAVTPDLVYFTEMSMVEYITCHGENVKVCDTVRSLQAFSHPTCAAAIFIDDKAAADKRCQISYETGDVQTRAVLLENGRYLVHVEKAGPDITWTLQCDRSASSKAIRQIASCITCVIEVPCGCSVDGGEFFIPLQLTDCAVSDRPEFPEVTHLFPVNLPVLMTKFSLDDIEHILGDTTFAQLTPDNPLALTDLTYNFTETVWADVVEKDELYQLDFKRLSERHEASAQAYTKDADYALRQATDYTDLAFAPVKELYDTITGFGDVLTPTHIKVVGSTVTIMSVLCLCSGIYFLCFVKK